jgi:hypothetical protein
VTARSLNQIIPCDAYNKAEVFLTQPLQIVAVRAFFLMVYSRRQVLT